MHLPHTTPPGPTRSAAFFMVVAGYAAVDRSTRRVSFIRLPTNNGMHVQTGNGLLTSGRKPARVACGRRPSIECCSQRSGPRRLIAG